jgi:hypothetical protein
VRLAQAANEIVASLLPFCVASRKDPASPSPNIGSCPCAVLLALTGVQFEDQMP